MRLIGSALDFALKKIYITHIFRWQIVGWLWWACESLWVLRWRWYLWCVHQRRLRVNAAWKDITHTQFRVIFSTAHAYCPNTFRCRHHSKEYRMNEYNNVTFRRQSHSIAHAVWYEVCKKKRRIKSIMERKCVIKLHNLIFYSIAFTLLATDGSAESLFCWKSFTKFLC